MEYWRNIEGYEGLYQVSNLGRVKSLGRVSVYKDGRKKVLHERILHNFLSDQGYYHVMLCKNGETKRFKVHRLVAMAFIPNPDNLPVVNHKDENPQNNVVENLEWCTQAYNVRYGTMIERGRMKQLNRSDLSKKVAQYTSDGELMASWLILLIQLVKSKGCIHNSELNQFQGAVEAVKSSKVNGNQLLLTKVISGNI